MAIRMGECISSHRSGSTMDHKNTSQNVATMYSAKSKASRQAPASAPHVVNSVRLDDLERHESSVWTMEMSEPCCARTRSSTRCRCHRDRHHRRRPHCAIQSQCRPKSCITCLHRKQTSGWSLSRITTWAAYVCDLEWWALLGWWRQLRPNVCHQSPPVILRSSVTSVVVQHAPSCFALARPVDASSHRVRMNSD